MWLPGIVELGLIHSYFFFLIRARFINNSVLLANIGHQLQYCIILLLQLKETKAKLFTFKIDKCGFGYQVVEACALTALNQCLHFGRLLFLSLVGLTIIESHGAS